MAGTKDIIAELGKDTRFKPGEAQVKIAKKGAEAANRKRKETRLFKDVIQERLAARGLSMESISDKLIDMALEHGGKDFEILRDTIGQKPSDKVEVKAVSIEDILKGNDPGL